MKSLLEKLKLVDHLTTEIPMDKKSFVEKLKMNVDEGNTGLLFSAFEIFRSSKNEYKGTVTPDTFKIRRRRKFLDMNLNLAVAEGRFNQRENILAIESTITGFQRAFIPYLFFIIVFYLAAIGMVIFSVNSSNHMTWLLVPFIFIHASLMLGIPYFVMRRGVSRMKYELEREFYYLAK